jgi:SOS-response transcriptional repressor LexA
MFSSAILSRLTQLKRFYAVNRRLPSYQEMLQVFSVASKNAAFAIVEHLVAAGYLLKQVGGKLAPAEQFFALPILGSIKAGYPDEVPTMEATWLSLEKYALADAGRYYLLQVRGDSMIEAGIFSGDQVVVDATAKPNSGDIVVAEIDQELTLKHLRQDKEGFYLEAANSAYPLFRPKTDLLIRGVVSSVVRQYR